MPRRRDVVVNPFDVVFLENFMSVQKSMLRTDRTLPAR
jgi:hypothetical protein